MAKKTQTPKSRTKNKIPHNPKSELKTKITPNPPSDIKTKITLLATSVVFVSLLLVALLLGQFSFVKVESLLDKHIMDIARTVAQIPTIQKRVGTRLGIQIYPAYSRTVYVTGDQCGIYNCFLAGRDKMCSAPNGEDIGKKLKGWDWEEVSQGKKIHNKNFKQFRAYPQGFYTDIQQ